MKIGNTGPINTAPLRRRGKTTSTSTSFAGQVAGDDAVQGPPPAPSIAATNSLLSVQEVEDPLEERRRAIQRGEDLLDQLDELRHGLLVGEFSSGKLDRILLMVRDRRDRVTDPKLKEILQEIELRAAVELAKMGRMR
jgi:hypothetical protein